MVRVLLAGTRGLCADRYHRGHVLFVLAMWGALLAVSHGTGAPPGKRRDSDDSPGLPVNAPPAVLVGTYVVAYAVVDDAVLFVQRHTLAVDGEWLGRVPLLAVCQDFETAQFMVLYCDATWDALAIAAGFNTLEEAQRRTEQSYVGVGTRWRDTGISREEALREHRAELARERCSFCGRPPQQVDLMFGEDARICNHCIEGFHKSLREGED